MVGGLMSDNVKLTKGSIGEYHATYQLLKMGYNVYQNCEANGQVDLKIESRVNRETINVDVKTAKGKLRPNQKDYPVKYKIYQLRIDDDGQMWIPCIWGEMFKKKIVVGANYYEKKGRFKLCMDYLNMPTDEVINE